MLLNGAITSRFLLRKQFTKVNPRHYRLFSTTPVDSTSTSDEYTDPRQPRNPQTFVKNRFEPAEWDDEWNQTDPLHLPLHKSRARIMDKDDFANRPTVGFSERFQSLHDARIVLSWLNHEDADAIYGEYLSRMMELNEGGDGADGDPATSHEYIVTELAVKHQLSSIRVTAIIQSGHSEEQIKRDGHELHYDLQRYVDEKIQANIADTYAYYRETNPERFVEELVTGKKEYHKRVIEVDDSHDLDDLESKAIVADRERAQRILDSKVYLEDLDDEITETVLDQECMDLISAANENHKIHKAVIGTVSIPHPSDDGSANANGSPAYKPKPKHRFAALKLNVREERDLKRMNQKHTWKKIRAKRNKNKSVNNYHSTTMIEYDGTVRPATVEELKCVSWKPPRSDNIKEFMMRDVKKAWVQRQKGVEDAWGRMDAFVPPKVEGEVEVEGVKEEEKDGVKDEVTN